eukprot:scaffold86538_cov45-Attheya_sp.AAC.1
MGKGKDKNRRTRRKENKKEKASKEKQKADKEEKRVVQDAAESAEAKRGFIGMWQSATQPQQQPDVPVPRDRAAPLPGPEEPVDVPNVPDSGADDPPDPRWGSYFFRIHLS